MESSSYVLKEYLEKAFGKLERGYLCYRIPGGPASSGDDVALPMEQIPGTRTAIDIMITAARDDVSQEELFWWFENFDIPVDKKKFSETCVRVYITNFSKGVKYEYGRYGLVQYPVEYGFVIYFWPKKKNFKEGKIFQAGREEGDRELYYVPMSRISEMDELKALKEDWARVIKIWKEAGVQIKWLKSTRGCVGDYYIKSK